MPSLPQGAFATCKLRSHSSAANKSSAPTAETMTEKVENNDDDDGNSKDIPTIFNKKFIDDKISMEYTPVKYNGKLMNSIWGLYNRYSPHNIKGNDDEIVLKQGYLQQPLTVATYVIAKNIAITNKTIFGDEWKFPGSK